MASGEAAHHPISGPEAVSSDGLEPTRLGLKPSQTLGARFQDLMKHAAQTERGPPRGRVGPGNVAWLDLQAGSFYC